MLDKPKIKDLNIFYRELNDYYIEMIGWISRKRAFIEEMNVLDRDYYNGKIKYLVYEKKKKRLLGKYDKKKEVIDSYDIEIKRIVSFAQKKLEQINLITLSDDTIDNLLKNSSHLRYADIERLRKEILDLEIRKEKLDNKLNYNQERIQKEREEDLLNLQKEQTFVKDNNQIENTDVSKIKFKVKNKFLLMILRFIYGSDSIQELKYKQIGKSENVDDKKEFSKIQKEKHKKEISVKEEKIKIQVLYKESMSISDFVKSYIRIFGYNFSLFKETFLYMIKIGYWNFLRFFGKDNGFTNRDLKNIQVDKEVLLRESRNLTGLDKKLQEESLKELNKNIDQIKSDNLRDEASFLNTKVGLSGLFSQISPVSNMIVRRISAFIVNKFPILFRSLYDDLRSANINILSISYLSIAIFASSVFGFLGFIVMLIIFRNTLSFGHVFEAFFIGGVIASGIFLFFLSYPKMVKSSRRKNILRNIHFGLINFSALVVSDADMVSVFKTISKQKDLGEFAIEFEKIYKYIYYFGYDITQALSFASLTTPCQELQDFLDGFLTTFQSGGDLKLFVSEKSEDVINTYELKQEKNVQKMSTISDVYTAIMIAAPLFLVAILSMVGMLGGNIGGMPINQVILLGTYVVIPLLNVGFIVFIATQQED
ncbi:MAG: type II secretion system F family protein [Candidatus Nanoarchaeia archaeon]|nr:type II secretion system F family protein [Candidatus Nanoarchaeia archaeon]